MTRHVGNNPSVEVFFLSTLSIQYEHKYISRMINSVVVASMNPHAKYNECTFTDMHG